MEPQTAMISYKETQNTNPSSPFFFSSGLTVADTIVSSISMHVESERRRLWLASRRPCAAPPATRHGRTALTSPLRLASKRRPRPDEVFFPFEPFFRVVFLRLKILLGPYSCLLNKTISTLS